jgi:hypothetical protein
MRLSPPVTRIALVLVLTALVSFPAGATTLIRESLKTLTDDNAMVVHGKVLDIHSYWNAEHTMIMTDVTVRPSQVLKGDRVVRDVTFTLLGGTVGDITTLIIGGPELVPGSEYVLFLNRERLHGDREVLTVRGLVQGAFDVSGEGAARRAFSQALSHVLLPDEEGLSEPPGGVDGFALDDLLSQVRQLAGDR